MVECLVPWVDRVYCWVAAAMVARQTDRVYYWVVAARKVRQTDRDYLAAVAMVARQIVLVHLMLQSYREVSPLA